MSRIRLPRGVIAALRGPADLHSVLAIVLDLALIAGAIVGSIWWAHPVGYVGAVVLIGARQHALLVLMHEATHGLLFRNRRLNEWVGDWVLAWPLLTSLPAYRANHLAHHQHLNTPGDPDWARYFDPEAELHSKWATPIPRHRMALRLIQDAMGLGLIDQIRRVVVFGGHRSGGPPNLPRLAAYGVCAAGITALGIWPWVLLFWVLPMLTWLPLALRVRLWAEHSLPDGRMGTRTVVAGPIGRWLIAPHGIGYHIEHHAFPSVPVHRLHRVHTAMQTQGVFDVPGRQRTVGYAAAMAELCSGAPRSASAGRPEEGL